LPVPSVDSGYQKTLDNAWSGNAQTTKIVHDGTYGAGMLYAEWPTAEKNPVIELYSRFATREPRRGLFRAVWIGRETLAEQRAFYTGATEHMPSTASSRRPRRTLPRAHAPTTTGEGIYEWIVENTYRDPKTRAAASATSRRCSRPETSGASAPT